MDLADGPHPGEELVRFRQRKDLVEGTWEVKADGKTVASGKLPALDIGPRQEKEFSCRCRNSAAGWHGVLAEPELTSRKPTPLGEARP